MSQRKTTLCPPYFRTILQSAAGLATVAAVLLMCNIPATAKIDYHIDDGDQQYQISSNATDLSQVLDEAGVEHEEIDLVSSSTSGDVVSVSITRRQYVTVICDGVTTSTLADTQDTVSDILAHLNITLGEFDRVSADLDAQLQPGDTIEVYRATVSYITQTEPIAYTSVRVADPEMDRGDEAVTTQGVEGSTSTTYRVIQFADSKPQYEEIKTIVVDPVDEVVSYGTKVHFEKPTASYSTSSEYITNIDDEAGTFTTSKGDTYSFSEQLTLEATAYTAGPGALCSTGRLARVGVVAVDPKYIPYGTEMFIMSADGSFVYGIAVAGDCGGAIDNYDVDLYMNSESTCVKFGRRDVVAYIIDSENA